MIEHWMRRKRQPHRKDRSQERIRRDRYIPAPFPQSAPPPNQTTVNFWLTRSSATCIRIDQVIQPRLEDEQERSADHGEAEDGGEPVG